MANFTNPCIHLATRHPLLMFLKLPYIQPVQFQTPDLSQTLSPPTSSYQLMAPPATLLYKPETRELCSALSPSSLPRSSNHSYGGYF